MPRLTAFPALTVLIAGCMIAPSPASAQLSKWLLRSGSGEVETVDFGSGDPILGSVIPSFGLGGYEDVNLMTDAANQALFYTAVGSDNTIQVRTAAFQVMPNGYGLFGNVSSHSSAIIPRPCHPNQYFIIHHDGATNKHYRSTVDMALNGGQGEVVEKNLLIGAELGEGIAVSRQLQNGCRWLFGFGVDGDAFIIKRALLSESGIGAMSTAATVSAPDGTAWYSCLKLSPANDRIAISLPNALQPGAADVAIWPLDLATGELGSAQLIPLSDDPVVGIEFSPMGGYLYYAGNGAASDMEFGRAHLASGSVEVIDDAIGPWVLSIESAGNGRLYIGTAGFPRTLAEVRFPDAVGTGAVGYDRNALVFWNLGFLPALPNAIEGEPPGSTTTPDFVDFTVEELPGCEGHRFIPSTCLETSIQWDFGDGWTDQRHQPTHRYGVGEFDVTLSVTSCGQQISVTKPDLITIEGIQPIADFTAPDSVCQHDPVAFANASQLASEYHWWFGDGSTSAAENPAHAYGQHGLRVVTLVAQEGCIQDTVRQGIKVLPAAIASFTTNSDPCDERTYLVNTSDGGETWFWDFGDDESVYGWRDPTHVYQRMDAFEVMLISDPDNMCADTASMTLRAGYGLIPVAWFVPNAFSPNGDGNNDVLYVVGPEYCQSPVMSIHNKWGQLVWEGDSKTGWDGIIGGMPAPEGAYAYVLKGRLDDMKLGWFVLMR